MCKSIDKNQNYFFPFILSKNLINFNKKFAFNCVTKE